MLRNLLFLSSIPTPDLNQIKADSSTDFGTTLWFQISLHLLDKSLNPSYLSFLICKMRMIVSYLIVDVDGIGVL